MRKCPGRFRLWRERTTAQHHLDNERLIGMDSRIQRYLKARAANLGEWLVDLGCGHHGPLANRLGCDTSHVKVLRRWRRDGFKPRHVLDIGAHKGAWSHLAVEVFGPMKATLVEPQVELLKGAVQRVRQAGGEAVGLELGLGDTKGELSLNVTENVAAASLLMPDEGAETPAEWGVQTRQSRRVTVETLDGLFSAGGLETADVVKMDVQGFERQVLNGGRAYLATCKRMVIEVSVRPIYAGQALLPEIVEITSRYGYEIDDITEAGRSWPEGVLWQVDLWLVRRDSK